MRRLISTKFWLINEISESKVSRRRKTWEVQAEEHCQRESPVALEERLRSEAISEDSEEFAKTDRCFDK